MGRRFQQIIVVGLAAGSLLGGSAVAAQVDVAPALGLYVPFGGWAQQSDLGTGFTPKRRQLTAALAGARVTVWASQRLAVEGAFAFTPSQVAVTTEDGISDVSAGVLLASVRALFKVVTLLDGHPEDRTTWDVMVGAGPGLLNRSGSVWDNTSGVTAPALALTAAVATTLGGAVTLRFGVEDYVSWAQFDKGRPNQTRARLHQEVIASLGFVFRVAGP